MEKSTYTIQPKKQIFADRTSGFAIWKTYCEELGCEISVKGQDLADLTGSSVYVVEGSKDTDAYGDVIIVRSVLKKSERTDAQASEIVTLERCQVTRVTYTLAGNADSKSCFSVGEVRDRDGRRYPIVGNIPNFCEGQLLSIEGRWDRHPQYGRQIRVDRFRELLPDESISVDGMEKYLKSAFMEGIGEEFARRIVDKFGKKTIDVLDKHPERLKEIDGIGDKRMKKILDSWRKEKDLRDVRIFLKDFGLTDSRVEKVREKFKDRTMSALKENPYCLVEIAGIGFKTADAAALKKNIPYNSPFRLQNALQYVLSQDESENGNVFLWKRELITKTLACVNEDRAEQVTEKEMEKAVERAVGNGTVIMDGNAVYTRWNHAEETGVASMLYDLANPKDGGLIRWDSVSQADFEKTVSDIEKATGLKFEQKQRSAIRMAMRSPVSIVTGGPGTGKTTTTVAIVRSLDAVGMGKVLLAAPTGKAAKRLSEATGRRAETIHRLLGYNADGPSFNRDNRLSGDALIVDESSMIDIGLMHKLLSAVPDGMKVVFVGDVDQLPSIGPGKVFEDMICAGTVPTTRLSFVFRQQQQSAIIRAAHNIVNGFMPDLTGGKGNDFIFIPKTFEGDKDTTPPSKQHAEVNTAVADRIVGIVKGCLDRGLFNVNDIQVLSPMKSTPCGVEVLNRRLRDVANPQDGQKKEISCGENRILRVGDKVFCTKNNYRLNVMNGGVGVIVDISPGTGADGKERKEREVKVKMDDDSREVVFEKDDIRTLELAYAMTVHKSQGSEYPLVIIPVSTSFSRMQQRKILYTAVTRAKKNCLVVGEKSAMFKMVKDASLRRVDGQLLGKSRIERHSLLQERMRCSQELLAGETKELDRLIAENGRQADFDIRAAAIEKEAKLYRKSPLFERLAYVLMSHGISAEQVREFSEKGAITVDGMISREPICSNDPDPVKERAFLKLRYVRGAAVVTAPDSDREIDNFKTFVRNGDLCCGRNLKAEISALYYACLNREKTPVSKVSKMVETLSSLPKERQEALRSDPRVTHQMDAIIELSRDTSRLPAIRLHEQEMILEAKREEFAGLLNGCAAMKFAPYTVSGVTFSTPPYADGKPLNKCPGWQSANADYGHVDSITITNSKGKTETFSGDGIDSDNRIMLKRADGMVRYGIETGVAEFTPHKENGENMNVTERITQYKCKTTGL